MADPAASAVVTALKTALLASPGVSEIMVDGLRVIVDIRQLDYWERKAAREATTSTRPIAATCKVNHGTGA